jgi:hypothetical protein
MVKRRSGFAVDLPLSTQSISVPSSWALKPSRTTLVGSGANLRSVSRWDSQSGASAR